MKILLVAPPSQFWDQVQAALSRRAQVERFATREVLAFGGIARSSVRAWSAVRRIPFLKSINARLTDAHLIAHIRHQRPDVILLYKFGDISVDALRAIRQMGVRCAAWQIDPPNEPGIHALYELYAPVMDIIFHFDGSMVGSAGGVRVIHLPLAIDGERFAAARALADSNRKEYGVTFIGAPYPERIRLLQSIVHVQPTIFGWKGWQATPLASLYRGPVTSDEAALVYANSRIALNSNWVPAIAGVNLKTFEIPAAGGFQITDVREDLASLFKPGHDVVVYHSDDEFARQIDVYMNDGVARERIRRNGVARVLRDHSLDTRMHMLIDALTS